MKKLLSLVMSVIFGTSGFGAGLPIPAMAENCMQTENNELSVIVDRLEDNNYVVIEVCYGDYYKIINVKQEDFNKFKNEGDRIGAIAVDGKFYDNGIWCKEDLIPETYYQFKSNDNTVWWALTSEDLGFIPKMDKEYTLIYYDNDTTAENKNCGCPLEWECECELYDDIYLGIVAKQ